MSTYLNEKVPDDAVSAVRGDYQRLMRWHQEATKLRLRINWQPVIAAWQVFMKEPTWNNYYAYAKHDYETTHLHIDTLFSRQQDRVIYSQKDIDRMSEAAQRWTHAIEKRITELAADDIPDF